MDDILQKYCERVLSDIFITKEYLSLYGRIYELPINDGKIFDSYKEFWNIAERSFLYSGTIMLAKIFDKDKDEDSITVNKILNRAQSNKPHDRVKKQINIFNAELYNNEEKIRNLKTQRDKFYAHNDKISTEKLLEIANLTHGDKTNLLNLGKQICEYFLAYSKDEENSTHLWDNRGTLKFGTLLSCLNKTEKY